MDLLGVIRGVIEYSESDESDESFEPDAIEADRLARAIQLSLLPPERPTFRPLYDLPALAPPRPVRFRPPPPTMPKPSPPSPPIPARQPPLPPADRPLPMNPRILIHHGIYGPIPEPQWNATVEDITGSDEPVGITRLPDETECTGEVVLDNVGSFHDSRGNEPAQSSNRRP